MERNATWVPAPSRRVNLSGFMLALCGVAATLAWPIAARADDPLLTPGDFILAIDQDTPMSGSSYPAAETPPMILDNNTATKYLNFGQVNSGFIVTPTAGAATVRSMVITTANDAEERDPAAFTIYGTNDPIASADNSLGIGENWTQIATGTLSLPADRLTAGPAVSFTNETAYTSYKVLFTAVKDAGAANSMQISEVAMYESSDGTGTDVLDAGGTVLAIDADLAGWGGYPVAENTSFAIDGTAAQKYLNFGKENSGFIVKPSLGLTVVKSFQITTANDFPDRDPVGWALYGTTEPIASTDNSKGDGESWTLIASGDVTLPGDLNDATVGRNELGPMVAVTNTTAYNAYKVIFTSLRNTATADSMQIGEIQFYGTILSTLPDPLLSPSDYILAIDVDRSASWYPVAENPTKILDTATNTKYLNFGMDNTGFIVTPVFGPSTVQSMRLTTAGDAEERDPASYAIYGTNDTIVSMDNSHGTAENWTLIASGDLTTANGLALPATRQAAGPLIAFTNAASYKSYKVLFPTLKYTRAGVPTTPNSMQISGVALFETADASTATILSTTDAILAIDADVLAVSQSNYPAAETPQQAIDRIIATGTTTSKYLNFGIANTGFIVKPVVGTTVVNSFRITTANDHEERDPYTWALHGTNDPVTSGNNGFGDSENWTLIASGTMSGTLALPSARRSAGPMVTFTNTADYSAYRMVFVTLKNYAWNGSTNVAATPNSMQIAEIQFYGRIGLPCATPFADLDGDLDVDLTDFGIFQTCFTGLAGVASSRTCRCLDRAKDGDVDAEDLVQFLNCLSGPGVPWTQGLTPSCAP